MVDKSCAFLSAIELSPIILFYLSIVAIESVTGIVGNGFILVINLASWVRNRVVSSCDMILIFLSFSRLCLQSCMLMDFVCNLFYPSFYNQEDVYENFKAIFVFLNNSSLWFATWLGVFYCAKIANFNHSSFLWLKQNISSLVPWLLAGSLLFSFGSSLSFYWDIYKVYCNYSTAFPLENTTELKVIKNTNLFYVIFLCNASLSLPTIVFVSSIVLLISSLWRHTKRMQNNGTGLRDPSTEAHRGAIKSVFSFLILYFFNLIALILTLSNIFSAYGTWDILCMLVMSAYPMVHSVILILGNPKLRRVSLNFLHYASCHFRGGPK
ncbi:taste receptor type 2 member 40-like [Alligator mississippiensis]|uniref:taste receptor type 2 member 40-like n=1 Tax=Alligator mississippiensis TaxID=8496 RepID=UPI000711B4C3|nr:taste receptor type 2 member 40-like [Alligator mississippiensis]